MATEIATASNKLNGTYTNGSIYVRSGLICLSDNIEMSIVTCAANLFRFYVPKNGSENLPFCSSQIIGVKIRTLKHVLNISIKNRMQRWTMHFLCISDSLTVYAPYSTMQHRAVLYCTVYCVLRNYALLHSYPSHTSFHLALLSMLTDSF